MPEMDSKKNNKKERGELPNVFRYLDFRLFLKDWLAYQKASQSGLSLRDVARAAGLTPSHLSMAISGARSLTPAAFSKLIPVLELSPAEQSFFELLVTLGTASSQRVRLGALERMKRFRNYRKLNPKEAEVYQYLNRWYYVAIREMASLPDFRADEAWIQSRLRSHVELKEIKEALKFLKEGGFLEILPDGRAVPPEKRLECEGGVYSLSLAGFHRQMLSLASDSIESTPREERNLMGHAFAADAETFEKVQAILAEAYEKIRALDQERKGADSVYFVEFALFPFTRKEDKS